MRAAASSPANIAVMSKSADAVIAVLDDVLEKVSAAQLRYHEQETAIHLADAHIALAVALSGPEIGDISDERAATIETAARHLEGIQIPAELRAEAVGWSRDLRALAY